MNLAKKDIVEIRWHGRGGQGAKTAALLFADAALSEGKYIQAFPEYGPERMGAPVQSFDRLSDEPITLHCGISNPKYVVVLDPTLMASVDVLAGVPDDGMIIINTSKSPDEIRSTLKNSKVKVFTVDASKIAVETIGRNIPNTPMLGAMAKAAGLLNYERLLKDLEQKLKKKFASKQEVIAGNLNAVKRAYEEVRS
jgi:pyruvate ferredoxin oxidoreductase gamma subunit